MNEQSDAYYSYNLTCIGVSKLSTIRSESHVNRYSQAIGRYLEELDTLKGHRPFVT